VNLKIDTKLCDKCGTCISVCPVDALVLVNDIGVDKNKCIICKRCMQVCPVGALSAE